MNECNVKILKAKQASEYYNISISNLRKWAREGKVPVKITKGGQYQYIIKEESIECPKQISENIIYARVSSKKQFNDLQRQGDKLQRTFPEFTLIKDIGSGINFKRKGFIKILELLFQRKINKVVVANKDRFSRFGFEFFEWMFEQFGATLEVIQTNSTTELSSNEELANDIMEIITVFTARFYGSRRYKNNED
jgi:predicted site-specific integrase-resolvase